MQLTAQRLVKKRNRCLDACFKLFEKEIDAIFQKEKEAIMAMPSSSTGAAPTHKMPKGNDAIPFPRTSGGRFCGFGQLVCFGWSYSVQISSVSKTNISGQSQGGSSTSALTLTPSRLAKTPRALSALSGTSHLMKTQIQMLGNTSLLPSFHVSGTKVQNSTSTNNTQHSTTAQTNSSLISRQSSRVNFDSTLWPTPIARQNSMLHQFLQLRNGGQSSESQNLTDPKRSPDAHNMEEPRKMVTVYDALNLVPFHRNLAEEYQLHGPSLMKVCLYNAQVALKYGFTKICNSWKIAANCCRSIHAKRTLKIRFRREYQNLVQASPSSTEGFELSAQKHNCEAVRSWAFHPDAKALLNQLIARHGDTDFQTSAMICSVFAKATNKNITKDGGAFYSTFNIDTAVLPVESDLPRPLSAAAIIAQKSKLIQTTCSQRTAQIAARELRRVQRITRKKNLSECTPTYADSHGGGTPKEYDKELSDTAVSADGMFGGGQNIRSTITFAPNATTTPDGQGIGQSAKNFASSVAHTNLLNIPGILLSNFTSGRSPNRRSPARNASIVSMQRSQSDANFNSCHAWKNSNSNAEQAKLGKESGTANQLETPLLYASNSNLHDQYRRMYSEMLHRCGLSEKAIEILHLVENPSSSETNAAQSFLIQTVPPAEFKNCIKCAYCRLPVKGHLSACMSCGHGGHLLHMMEWFEDNDECAAACGCICLKEMDNEF